MTTLHKTLLGILVAQVGLAALTWWPHDNVADKLHPLFKVDRGTVTELTITGTPKEGTSPAPVHLVKADGSWVLSSMGGYPADETKVAEVLDKVTDIEVRSPIATQAADLDTLEVGDHMWTRRVQVVANGASTDLRLGAATSTSAHVRMSGGDDVYEIRGFSAWSIGDNDKRFFNPVYVEAKADDIKSLSITNPSGTLQLDLQGDAWTSPDLPADAKIDGEKVKKLLKKVATVRMTEPVGKDVKPEYGLDGGTTVRWASETTGESTAGGYRIGAVVDGNAWVKAEDDPWVVKVRESALKDVLGANLDGLLVTGQ